MIIFRRRSVDSIVSGFKKTYDDLLRQRDVETRRAEKHAARMERHHARRLHHEIEAGRAQTFAEKIGALIGEQPA